MKKSTYTFIAYLFIGVLFLISCSSEDVPGCTDPESASYDSEATTDDGSCSYERDIFLGTYQGSFVCPESASASSDNEVIGISPLSDRTDGINLNFLCCPQLDFDGTVENEVMKFNDFRTVQGFPYNGKFYNDATYSLNSEGRIENGKLIIEGQSKLINSAGSTIFAFDCTFVED